MTLQGLIILDGPDGSGKSTLAAALKREVEYRGSSAVVHHSAPIEGSDCWEVHSQELLGYIHSAFVMNKVVIMDRQFMSESVYGTVYRGGSVYPHAVRHIDRLLHRFRALRVVCAPEPEFVIEHHARLKNERDELYEDIAEVAVRYRALWDGVVGTMDPGGEGWAMSCGVRYDGKQDYLQQLSLAGGVKDTPGWYHYDLNHEGIYLKNYVSYLLHELGQEQRSASKFTLDPVKFTHTGFAHTGSVLLVGDEVAGPNRLMLPFYANSGSSLYLARTLHKLGAEENKVVICNVNDPSGLDQVQQLIEETNFSRKVIMGRQAERTFLHAGMRFDAVVRHPQHARRFSHNDNSYENELRAAFSGYAGVKKA